jgi:hypothetical protein
MASHVPHAWKAGAWSCTPSQLGTCFQEPLQLHCTLHRRQHDKLPVLAYHGRTTCKQEAFYSLVTLFYPGSPSLSRGVLRNPLSSVGGHSASRLSLLGLASGWWLCHLTIQSALAQRQYSTNVPKEQEMMLMGGGNSSPCLESRGLLATTVERYCSSVVASVSSLVR